MTTHLVYIWLDGKKMDLEAFSKSLAASKRGTIKERKAIAVQGATIPARYWQSEMQPTENPEEALCKLIAKYSHAVKIARKFGAKRVCAEIVTKRDQSDPVRGYYLHSTLISLLAKNNITLDLDIVRRLA